MCLVCSEDVAVNKEYNLKRHYHTKHSDKFDTYTGQLRNDKVTELRKGLTNQQCLFTKANATAEEATHASYTVSEILAKHLRPFKDGEFVKDCLNAVVDIICPKEKAAIGAVNLSRNTIMRRIEDLSKDVKSSLNELAALFISYSLALDESVDVRDTSQLAIFVRGIDGNFNVTEELAALVALKDTTSGADIFEAVTTTMKDLGLQFSNLCGVTTDGAPSMIGKNLGCAALLAKEKEAQGYGNLITAHCIIHQENLCAKSLEMPHVMSTVVKTVNFVRSRGLNHRQFQSFLASMESEYEDLLYFSAVRWLSRDTMLERFFVLRKEIAAFMEKKGKPVTELNDYAWICDLAFLVDITKHLNDLNVALQGKGQHIGLLTSHITAFEVKLRLWSTQLQANNNLAHFATLMSVSPPVSLRYSEKVNRLREEFAGRFSDLRQHSLDIALFVSPFEVDIDSAPNLYQMELVDLQCNTDLKAKFHDFPLMDFYQKYVRAEKLPHLRKNALKMASLFGSTYLCEQTFSRMKIAKSEGRSALSDKHLEATLRLSTTGLKPNMLRVMKTKQQLHCSH